MLKSYNQTSELLQDTKMQPAMCIQCLDNLNTKRTGSRSSVSYRCRLSIVVEGNSVRTWRGSCFQLMFKYKSSTFIQSLQRASATLKPSSMRELHSAQLHAKFLQVWPRNISVVNQVGVTFQNYFKQKVTIGKTIWQQQQKKTWI